MIYEGTNNNESSVCNIEIGELNSNDQVLQFVGLIRSYASPNQ